LILGGNIISAVDIMNMLLKDDEVIRSRKEGQQYNVQKEQGKQDKQ
jgi:hypothetical protein